MPPPGGAPGPMGAAAMPMPLPPISRKRRKTGKHKLSRRRTRKGT